MTSRRTFLRVLGAAVVGAVVLPQLPVSVPAWESTHLWWRRQVGGSCGDPLALKTAMRETYNACSRGGGMAPQRIITTRKVYESYARMCGLVYDMEMAA